MSAWIMIPYYNRQVELGQMTREEADEAINHMIEIDNKPELIINEELVDKFNSIPFGGNFLDYEFERKYLGKWDISDPIKYNFGSEACVNCSNNPKNGGDGICFCILGQMEIR